MDGSTDSREKCRGIKIWEFLAKKKEERKNKRNKHFWNFYSCGFYIIFSPNLISQIKDFLKQKYNYIL